MLEMKVKGFRVSEVDVNFSNMLEKGRKKLEKGQIVNSR